MAFLSSFIEVAERLAGKQAGVFFGRGGYVSTVYFSRRQNRDLYLNRTECLDASNTSVMTPIIVLYSLSKFTKDETPL